MLGLVDWVARLGKRRLAIECREVWNAETTLEQGDGGLYILCSSVRLPVNEVGV